MGIRKSALEIVDELHTVLSDLNDRQGEQLCEMILQAQQIFVAGAGRSGFATRAFANRLMHMGLKTHVVGETVTPSITEHDVLIIGSGSGSTASLVEIAKKAKAIGVRIALLTTAPNSPIGEMADLVLPIRAPSSKVEHRFTSVQPMASLFEQSLLITLDALIMELMLKTHQTAEMMYKRHANLE